MRKEEKKKSCAIKRTFYDCQEQDIPFNKNLRFQLQCLEILGLQVFIEKC